MKGKVLVGIPQYSGMIRVSFPFVCTTLLEAQKRYPQLEIELKATDRIGLPLAHRRIVGYFLRNKFDYLFLVEEDICPPRDCLVRLLEHDLDIVSALIFQRSFPYQPMLYRYDKKRLRHFPIQTWQENSLVEVEFTGLGCILFKREVFEKVSVDSFKCLNLYSDDFLFFRAVKEEGFRVFVDTSVVCKHVYEQYNFIDEGYHERAKQKLKAKSVWQKSTKSD